MLYLMACYIYVYFCFSFHDFSAHLSQRLMLEIIVYQSLRTSTISNIFSSETTGPIELKFHMETPLDAVTEVCSNGSGHMTKMAAYHIYGKNL